MKMQSIALTIDEAEESHICVHVDNRHDMHQFMVAIKRLNIKVKSTAGIDAHLVEGRLGFSDTKSW